ncbi:MAG: class I SAM-dependent methyltransferase [Candidatus Hodarchaeota archaeon]
MDNFFKMLMKKSTFFNISSQLDLPFLETNEDHIKSIFETLKQKYGLREHSNQQLIDLGAGNGRIVIYSAIKYDIKSVGIEINLNLINEAKSYLKSLRAEKIHHKKVLKKIKFIHGDLFEANLKDFEFIYIYSFPPMHKYLPHLISTAKRGSILISYKYTLDGFERLKLDCKLINEMSKQPIFTFFYIFV